MEAAAGATADASLEARWPTERLGVGKGLVSGGEDSFLLFLMPAQAGGGGILWRWRRQKLKWKSAQMVRKQNEERIKDKRRS